MAADTEGSVPFARWIARPQSLIALAAVLLSLCGLFIAVYEAALIRREQRASVWPFVQVSASLSGERVEVWVQNVGVGPARVRAAVVSRDGERRRDWGDLIRQLDMEPQSVDTYYSLLRGRVLPRDSEREVVFGVTREGGPAAPELIRQLRREILEGRIDVTVCYCSVYDECWTSRLQDVVRRSRGVEAAVGDGAVESCEEAPASGI